MSTHSGPPRRQQRIRIPAHTETQRQRIPNDDACGRVRRARDAVCRSGGDNAGVGRARGRVQQHVQMALYVQVRQLQGAGQGDDEGYVVAAEAALALDLVGQVGVGWGGRGRRDQGSSGNTA